MKSIFSMITTLVVATSSDPKIVGYIDFPTCSGVGVTTDEACAAALGVPGYADHPYNVLIFAFYVSDQDLLYDAAKVWAYPSSYFTAAFRAQITGLSSPTDQDFRRAVKALYKAAGIKLLLSVGGATDHPITSGLDPTALAIKTAELVALYDYDGADIDFEGTSHFNTGDGKGEDWLITLTKKLRIELGADYIITHAPQAPYFMGMPNYRAGAYLKVHEEAGDDIDWYNIQFYNQGSTTYGDYNSLFIASNGWSGNTAITELLDGSNSFGVSIPYEKIVIGKYVRDNVDGFAGWISADNLKAMFLQFEWTNGFMLWQVPGDALTNYAYSKKIAEAFDAIPPTESTTPAPVTPTTSTTPAPVTSTTSTTPAPITPTITPSHNIMLTNFGTLGKWWYVATIDGESQSIQKMEIMYPDNTYLECNNGEADRWSCTPTKELALPITVRLTSVTNQVIVGNAIITSYDDAAVFDFGSNFGSSPTPNPVTSTTPSPVSTPSPVTSTTPSPVTTFPSLESTSTTTPSQVSTTSTTSIYTTSTTTTSSTTPSPVGSGSNIQIINDGSLSEWWYAADIEGASEDVDKMEIKYADNTWLLCSDADYAWTCQAGQALQVPLTMRLTSKFGKVIVGDGIVTSLDDKAQFDFGTNF